MNKEDNKEKNKLFYVVLMFGGFLCMVPMMGIKITLLTMGVLMVMVGLILFGEKNLWWD